MTSFPCYISFVIKFDFNLDAAVFELTIYSRGTVGVYERKKARETVVCVGNKRIIMS